MSVRDAAWPVGKATEGEAQPLSSWLIATGVCVGVVVVFLFTTSRMWHWFVIPVLLSGILIGKDAIEWFRGRLEAMDPLGLFSLFGLHFFFLAYLLHVSLDFYWHYRYPPEDWRPWLGYAAAANVAGLLLYRWTIRFEPRSRPATVWRIEKPRLVVAALAALVGTAFLQVLIYERFGGILEAAYARENRPRGGDPFEGLGWAITLAESFPVVFVIVLLVLTRNSRLWQSKWAIPALLIPTFLLALLFGGVRGSRSTIFVVLFWALVLFHIYVRPFSRKLILIGPLVLFLFMTGYLFYKHGGVEGASQIGNVEVLEEIEDRIGFGDVYSFILLHDFARADSQALLLYLNATDDSYSYALGRTILAGAVSVVPRALWPDRPENANREKSALLYGPGSNRPVSWVFGLPGEFLLNFGPLSLPLAFPIVAGVVMLARHTRWWQRTGDARALLWPLLLYMCFATPLGETQLFLWAIAKNGLVPGMVVAVSCRRVSVSPVLPPDPA